MDVERIKRIMNSLMILSFFVFGGLSAILLVTDASLNNATASLPFAFMFISAVTFITTGQINEKPKLVHKHLVNWLIICVIGIIISALAFTFY
jgi:hypothetical protein